MTVRGLAILLMLCALFGHGQSTGTSKETRSLFTLLNGAYDNRDQVQNENSGNDVIYMRFIPAVVSELGPDFALFLELVSRVKIVSQNVLVYAEESSSYKRQSRPTTMFVYNITSANIHEKPPGSITVDDVSNLYLGDLQRIDNCVARFQTIDDGLLVGVFQNCLDSSYGIPSQYVSILRSLDYIVVVPPGLNQVPLHFLRRGPRFPIPGETSNSDNADD